MYWTILSIPLAITVLWHFGAYSSGFWLGFLLMKIAYILQDICVTFFSPIHYVIYLMEYIQAQTYLCLRFAIHSFFEGFVMGLHEPLRLLTSTGQIPILGILFLAFIPAIIYVLFFLPPVKECIDQNCEVDCENCSR